VYRLEGLTKRFGDGPPALERIDLRIERGARVAFVGPSGAGKTTLFRLLNLALAPTAGRLVFAGTDTRGLSGRALRATRRRIGTIYQQQNLVPRLRVVHNVLAGRLGAWPLWTALFSLARPAEVHLAERALQRVGMPEKLFARTDELSGGQQQRVAIARVLVQDPEVILADEPVSSVDPGLASAIVALLVDVSARDGKTLLMNLHSVELARSFFPRLVGIKDGRVLFDAPASRVTDELLDELYGAAVGPPPNGAEAIHAEKGAFGPARVLPGSA
jgi:phosphonate transport system ATP-binding protein